ncbi:hypothetical protein RFI_32585 [Reticulomyxa filosa]|uniref:Uncharacterized protein n=1 Tax=Reticulomyxa filosa TaxID=46433 RepID=X6LT35_RETFI|nr:hypothetical protein RFI_32585 [Reticulomyxa filosa]|eukprot:ETO04809.1 hypothetical protein RFI_32585 [Reticulomyxa filosa]
MGRGVEILCEQEFGEKTKKAKRVEKKKHRYNIELCGIIMCYENVKTLHKTADIIDEEPHLYVDIECDWVILILECNRLYSGTVCRVSKDILTCLLCNTFNVSIPLSAEYMKQNKLVLEDRSVIPFFLTSVSYQDRILILKGSLQNIDPNTIFVSKGIASLSEELVPEDNTTQNPNNDNDNHDSDDSDEDTDNEKDNGIPTTSITLLPTNNTLDPQDIATIQRATDNDNVDTDANSDANDANTDANDADANTNTNINANANANTNANTDANDSDDSDDSDDDSDSDDSDEDKKESEVKVGNTPSNTQHNAPEKTGKRKNSFEEQNQTDDIVKVTVEPPPKKRRKN